MLWVKAGMTRPPTIAIMSTSSIKANRMLPSSCPGHRPVLAK